MSGHPIDSPVIKNASKIRSWGDQHDDQVLWRPTWTATSN